VVHKGGKNSAVTITRIEEGERTICQGRGQHSGRPGKGVAQGIHYTLGTTRSKRLERETHNPNQETILEVKPRIIFPERKSPSSKEENVKVKRYSTVNEERRTGLRPERELPPHLLQGGEREKRKKAVEGGRGEAVHKNRRCARALRQRSENDR